MGECTFVYACALSICVYIVSVCMPFCVHLFCFLVFGFYGGHIH